MGRLRWRMMIVAALAVVVPAVASGCGSSAEQAATAKPAASNTPPAGAVEKTPPPKVAKAMKHMAASSSDPKPTWGEWAITTLADAARSFATDGDIENDPEWAADPRRRVAVIIVHGTFENTRVGSGPAGSELPPPVFAWHTSMDAVDSRQSLMTMYTVERPDTSSMGSMYVYSW